MRRRKAIVAGLVGLVESKLLRVQQYIGEAVMPHCLLLSLARPELNTKTRPSW